MTKQAHFLGHWVDIPMVLPFMTEAFIYHFGLHLNTLNEILKETELKLCHHDIA